MVVKNNMETEMPNQIKKIMWSILNNKALDRWYIAHKRTFVGPRWCNLCHKVEETNGHVIMSFSFTKEVWKEVERMIGF